MANEKDRNANRNSKPTQKRGGLGRGLAALIPTSPDPRNGVGDGAADIIFGPRGNGQQKSAEKDKDFSNSSQAAGTTQGAGLKRHSDDKVTATSVTPDSHGNDDLKSTAATQSSQQEATSNTDIGATYQELRLDLIAPNPRQPREVFDEEPLRELAHSISEFGLMQPIVVRPMPEDHQRSALKQLRKDNPKAKAPQYEIIMGERRWRASQLAKLTFIPAIVRSTSDTAMLRDALLENIHRVQLNPLEEAAAYQQLLEEFGVTQAQLADKIGRSRPVITNMIRLLQLPVPVQRRVAAGVLSAGHARALLGIKRGSQFQESLADRIVAEGLSVRATEEAVTLINRGDEPAQREKKPAAPQPEQLGMWADRLADSFDTRVTATMGKKKGRIVIEFGDLEDFERIVSLLEQE